jgi:probable phosphoglycerate mutase
MAEKNSAPISIYSSPLERAMETAEPLATVLGLEVIPRPGLIETDVGEWQGKTVKGLSRLKIWRKVLGAPSLMRFPGGESFSEAQYRICQEIEWLRTQHDPKDLISCFSHADPLKLAIAYYLGMPLDMFQRLSISRLITALHLGDSQQR